MSNIIEIKYQDDQDTSTIELIDLLNHIKGDKTEQLIWSILDLEAVGDISLIWERGILDLEANIRFLPKGLILSWQMLVQLAQRFDQVINTVIVGCQEVSEIPSLEPNIDPDPHCEIVLELVDSSIWRIYTKDPLLSMHLALFDTRQSNKLVVTHH
ncbi:MAG: hypothetical protein ACK456_10320 [Pseudanabaenaceae cyanobacterium]|jgi:hypothetical protein